MCSCLAVLVMLGLGCWGEACSKRPARGKLALASSAEAVFPKRFVVVVVVVVGLGLFGEKLWSLGVQTWTACKMHSRCKRQKTMQNATSEFRSGIAFSH